MEFAPAIIAKLREQAERHSELTELMSDPDVASDPKKFPEILKERGRLTQASELFARYEELLSQEQEARSILESSDADDDDRALAEEILEEVTPQAEELDGEMKAALVKDEDDDRAKVIFEIRAGTGGDEATLFARDLYRMYHAYFDSKRWKSEDLDVSTSEVGGFKEVIFAVQGEGAWSRLKFESGGHRVQRVPATETQGRVHTSAATVAVLPEAEDVDLEIKPEDLRVDTMRSSGPGGQSVNKTSSAVRMTHIPTGTVVSCQDEKSQHKNRAKALRIMKSRLFEAEQQRLHAERAAERKSQVGTGDRNARVRTYNFPQNRLTDHRVGENYSLEQVVSGKLDPVLDALEAMERERPIRARASSSTAARGSVRARRRGAFGEKESRRSTWPADSKAGRLRGTPSSVPTGLRAFPSCDR